jgi:hypothetical protein
MAWVELFYEWADADSHHWVTRLKTPISDAFAALAMMRGEINSHLSRGVVCIGCGFQALNQDEAKEAAGLFRKDGPHGDA